MFANQGSTVYQNKMAEADQQGWEDSWEYKDELEPFLL
jgi:hypothetical protein